MMQRTEVYISHDNVTGIIPTEDGAPVSFGAVTRVVVTINGVDFDSSVLGSSAIWWTDTVVHEEQTVDVLKFKLGGQAGLLPGVYSGCRVKVYDAVNTNGIVWIDDMLVSVA